MAKRTADKLMALYDAMRSAHGPLDWWPGETRLEICVGAILTQNTNWTNVEMAIANLKKNRVLTLAALNELELDELAELIRPAGYFNLKAKRLQSFTMSVAAAGGLGRFFRPPTSELRRNLLAIHGIGPETADSILLYAAGRTKFVVDGYTGRLFRRHGLVADGETRYDVIQELCESNLPADADLFNDFHAQIVEIGKRFCKPKPKCAECPFAGGNTTPRNHRTTISTILSRPEGKRRRIRSISRTIPRFFGAQINNFSIKFCSASNFSSTGGIFRP